MKHGPFLRHSKELVRSALQRLERGEGLSQVARSLGISKTTVKYWSDNAPKFLADEGKAFYGAGGRVQAQISVHGWNLLLKVYREVNRRLPEATFKDLVYALSQLHERLPQLTAASPGGRVPSRVLEVQEETRLTVKEYLEKQKRVLEPAVEAIPAEQATLLAEHPPEGRAVAAGGDGRPTGEAGENGAKDAGVGST